MPTVEQLHELLLCISQRVARFLERRGILERDEDNSYLTLDDLEEDPLQDIHSHAVTYRQGALRAEDAISQRHYPCDLRAIGLHCEAGRSGA